MHISLSDDVYIVEGYNKDCIYDLKLGRLFSISKNLTKEITHGLNNPDYSPSKSIKSLLDLGVLCYQKQVTSLKSIQEIREIPKISYIRVEVTRKCNLKCTFCYEESSMEHNKYLSFEDFKSIVDQLVEFTTVEYFQFIGGEPLILGDKLKEMIKYVYGKFEHISIYSNGTLLNRSWCEFLKRHNIFFKTSVHSYIPEEHDKVTCVKGSHDRISKAIALLQKYEVTHTVVTIETNECKVGSKPVDSTYELSEHRHDRIRLVGRADFSQYSYELFEKKAITKESFRKPLDKAKVVKAISGNRCYSTKLHISSDLDVLPCSLEKRLVHGNLKDAPISQLINKSICGLSSDQINGCKVCEYRYACHYDCRPDSMGLGVNDKPWYCSYDPYMGEWDDLKKMFANLKKGLFHPSVYGPTAKKEHSNIV